MSENHQSCGGGCASCSKGGTVDPALRGAPSGVSLVWRAFAAFILPLLTAVAGGGITKMYSEGKNAVVVGVFLGLAAGVLIARVLFWLTRRSSPACSLSETVATENSCNMNTKEQSTSEKPS